MSLLVIFREVYQEYRVISPENIAKQNYQHNFEEWKEFATKSLKAKSLDKYLNINSLEGIERSIFYDHSNQIECHSYPTKQKKVQFYDFKKYHKDFLEIDKELGHKQHVFQLQNINADLSSFDSNSLVLHLQNSSDEMIETYKGFHFYIDVNDLLFKSFEEEIKRVKSKKKDACFLIDLSHVHNAGGSVIQEITYALSLFAALLEREVLSSQIAFRVSCHSEIFLNIAKLKALRYLVEKMCDQAGQSYDFQIHGSNSLREQTLYDPWNNMLRNCSSTMSQILGGANTISTRSYDYLFARLTFEMPSSLGHRYAIQTLNILFEESHLDEIIDPTSGSFYIENICEQICKKSWESFLNWRERNFLENVQNFSVEVEAISKRRVEQVNLRKKIISGINDFADPSQTIESLYKKKWKPIELKFGFFPLRRLAFDFESARLRNEFSQTKKKVAIITHGKLSQIIARLNFIKNIFDTAIIPYEVFSSDKTINQDDYSGLILCAIDQDYSALLANYEKQDVFIAGRLEEKRENVTEIFMGMDILAFVQKFVEEEQV